VTGELYRPPTAMHRVEHAGVLAFRAVLRGVGRSGSAAIGGVVGRLAYYMGVRRAVVEEHLRASFPNEGGRWRRRVARRSYVHLGRETAAMIRLSAVEPAAVRELTTVAGLDSLEAALAEGRGVVLVTGHLGNWEVGGSALAVRGLPVDAVAQRQANPLVERMLLNARERLGMRVIERSRASRDALRSLRDGRLVAFVADQDGRGSGVFVPFMGRPASTHRGPALLALRAGAPLFFGRALRSGAGYDVVVRRLDVDRSGPREEAVRRMTGTFTAALESEVRAHPEQYFWQHRRWKTRPPAN
jgi:KDO2-lipid IV(A) lauroyltransferase